MASSTIDKYANMAALKITESAANTFTASKFAFPFSIMDKMGLIIHRVEYDHTNPTGSLTAAGDKMYLGLSVAASVTDPTDPTDPLVLDCRRIVRWDAGAAASAVILQYPRTVDFTNLPGGGLLVAPNPLYGFIKGDSAAVAGTCTIRMFYTYIELATDEYWQLVESRRIITG